MKKIVFLFLLSSVVIGSCKINKHFEKYIGTWEPAFDQNQQLISRLQFMKLEDFYIVCIDYKFILSDEVFFYVCEKEKNYLIIKPSKYAFESDDSDYILTGPTKIYYDPEFNKIYFSNFVFKSSYKRIFQFINNELTILKE